MSHILILAHKHDLHAHAVRYALSEKDVSASFWSLPQFASTQTASIRIGPQVTLSPSLTLEGQPVDLDSVSTVWARRPVFPSVPQASDPRDATQIKQENSLFVQGLWWLLSTDRFWVNPYEGRRRIKSKPMQLAHALAAGLRVPDTIFGNDPQRIRDFIDRWVNHGVIYKPHRVSEWEEDGHRFLLHTRPISPDDFSDHEFKLCAGIYQEKIKKKYELRIHILGRFVRAIKIDSQINAEAQNDWRSANPSSLTYEVVTLPDELQTRLLKLLGSLGAVFGIVDGIVTPEGDFVFLEVNEMGQFLWVDAYCPDARLLDHFCSFLAYGSSNYSGNIIGPHVNYLDIRCNDEFRRQFEASKAEHGEPNYEVDWLDILV